MCIELGEPAMIVTMLQHFFLPMKPKMGCVSAASYGKCVLLDGGKALGRMPCAGDTIRTPSIFLSTSFKS